MLKKILTATLPLPLLLLTAVSANDTELDIDVASITDADVEVVETDFTADVDQLTADAGNEPATDAVEACFRRFGYRHGGWHHGHYGHRYYGGGGGGWNSCYSNWNYGTPYYGYSSCCVQPVYQYSCVSVPTYSCYWGCY